MSKMKDDLLKCKDYSNIIDEIEKALDNEGIPVVKTSKNQLVVKDKTKKEIESVINTLTIPKVIQILSLSVKESNGSVYIRRKIK